MSIARCDVYCKVASSHKMEGVGEFAFTIKDVWTVRIHLLKINEEIDDHEELLLKPWFEIGDVRMRIEIGLGEQLVFASGECEVEFGKRLMSAPSPEKSSTGWPKNG